MLSCLRFLEELILLNSQPTIYIYFGDSAYLAVLGGPFLIGLLFVLAISEYYIPYMKTMAHSGVSTSSAT
jgi:hypothetical protein